MPLPVLPISALGVVRGQSPDRPNCPPGAQPYISSSGTGCAGGYGLIKATGFKGPLATYEEGRAALRRIYGERGQAVPTWLSNPLSKYFNPTTPTGISPSPVSPINPVRPGLPGTPGSPRPTDPKWVVVDPTTGQPVSGRPPNTLMDLYERLYGSLFGYSPTTPTDYGSALIVPAEYEAPSTGGSSSFIPLLLLAGAGVVGYYFYKKSKGAT